LKSPLTAMSPIAASTGCGSSRRRPAKKSVMADVTVIVVCRELPNSRNTRPASRQESPLAAAKPELTASPLRRAGQVEGAWRQERARGSNGA